MRVNAATGIAIISSDKQIDSGTISARFYANNSIYDVDFKIDEELEIGNQFTIKIPASAKEKKKGIVVNTYGGVSIRTPIPSLKIGSKKVDSKDIFLHYHCHIVADDFLIVSNDGQHAITNLEDIISDNKEIELVTREKEHQKLAIKSARKMCKNFIKIEVEGIKSLKSIATYYSAEIEKSLTLATVNKKHIIESLNE